MTTITAAQVADLRKRTGVGMMAVKKALEEASGDEEKAIEILRKRGEAQAVKKSERDQKEGSIFCATSGNRAALVFVACETDFVARSDNFRATGQNLAKIALEKGPDAAKKSAETLMPDLVNKLGENVSLSDVRIIEGTTLGSYVHTNSKIGVVVALDPSTSLGQGPWNEIAKDVAMHAAALAPDVVSPEEVSSKLVEKEKEIWREQLKNEGKPEAIWDKIMIGKEKKFREESALLKQPFAKNPKITVEKYLDGAKVTAYVRLAV